MVLDLLGAKMLVVLILQRSDPTARSAPSGFPHFLRNYEVQVMKLTGVLVIIARLSVIKIISVR